MINFENHQTKIEIIQDQFQILQYRAHFQQPRNTKSKYRLEEKTKRKVRWETKLKLRPN